MTQCTIGHVTQGYFRYMGWPSVAYQNGTLYAVCSGHRLAHVCPFGKNLMFTSTDQGETWSAPQIVNDTFLDDRDAGIVALGGHKLLLSWFNHPARFYLENLDWVKRGSDPMAHALAEGAVTGLAQLTREQAMGGSFVRLSDDDGKTWTEPAIRVPVTAPHGPVLLKNGHLFYLGKEFLSEHTEYHLEKGHIYAFDSADGGLTWQQLGKVPLPEGVTTANLHEPHAVELPDGRILCAIRAQGAEVYHKFTMYLCHTDDGGKTFSVPTPTGISGSPPHLLRHSTGAVILAYARREPPYGEYVRVSHDGGEHFGEETCLREGTDHDLGYPATTELRDGSLLTVYYHKLPGEKPCSLLGTKWRLEEMGKEK